MRNINNQDRLQPIWTASYTFWCTPQYVLQTEVRFFLKPWSLEPSPLSISVSDLPLGHCSASALGVIDLVTGSPPPFARSHAWSVWLFQLLLEATQRHPESDSSPLSAIQICQQSRRLAFKKHPLICFFLLLFALYVARSAASSPANPGTGDRATWNRCAKRKGKAQPGRGSGNVNRKWTNGTPTLQRETKTLLTSWMETHRSALPEGDRGGKCAVRQAKNKCLLSVWDCDIAKKTDTHESLCWLVRRWWSEDGCYFRRWQMSVCVCVCVCVWVYVRMWFEHYQ